MVIFIDKGLSVTTFMLMKPENQVDTGGKTNIPQHTNSLDSENFGHQQSR